MSLLSHSELTLLAFLEERPLHAYELVRRVRATQVARWARVPESTLYAVLRRMEAKGWVEASREPGARGRSRTRYARTRSGRARLEELIQRGLSAPGPVYSDLLVSAVFAAGIGDAASLATARHALAEQLAALKAAVAATAVSEFGRVVLDFYRSLAEIHWRALVELERLARSASEGTTRAGRSGRIQDPEPHPPATSGDGIQSE